MVILQLAVVIMVQYLVMRKAEVFFVPLLCLGSARRTGFEGV